MLSKNSKLFSLNEIPKTIILLIDEKQKVIESCGKQLSSFNIEVDNKNLTKLFSKINYSFLKSLLLKITDSVNLIWQDINFEVSIQEIEGSKNKALYLFDITKYSKVEIEFNKSIHDLVSKKEEQQAFFDLAANGISILDKKGMFLYANNFFQEMMGYTMEELYKESCISLSSKEFKKPSETAVETAIREGSVVNFRKVCISKSGEHMNASMSLSYLKSSGKILMITSDITDDIKYQEELKKQVELEVEKRRQQHEIMCHQSRLAAMGEMIDSIAHQWRQPLNGLGIIVQGLKHISKKESLKKETLLEIESEIMEKVNYMSQTIDDFSTFFRLSKKKETFDLFTNIKEAIRLIDVQLKINNIEVKIESKIKEDIRVLGFSNEFRQVMMNIVHNSMMAIIIKKRERGAIGICVKVDNQLINIDIIDNGGGIKKENISKIFDPYFTTRENGSGIGLYMSKVIIEHHMKGRLSIKNHKDGAKFSISFKGLI